jgi:hypothetical protein
MTTNAERVPDKHNSHQYSAAYSWRLRDGDWVPSPLLEHHFKRLTDHALEKTTSPKGRPVITTSLRVAKAGAVWTIRSDKGAIPWECWGFPTAFREMAPTMAELDKDPSYDFSALLDKDPDGVHGWRYLLEDGWEAIMLLPHPLSLLAQQEREDMFAQPEEPPMALQQTLKDGLLVWRGGKNVLLYHASKYLVGGEYCASGAPWGVPYRTFHIPEGGPGWMMLAEAAYARRGLSYGEATQLVARLGWQERHIPGRECNRTVIGDRHDEAFDELRAAASQETAYLRQRHSFDYSGWGEHGWGFRLRNGTAGRLIFPFDRAGHTLGIFISEPGGRQAHWSSQDPPSRGGAVWETLEPNVFWYHRPLLLEEPLDLMTPEGAAELCDQMGQILGDMMLLLEAEVERG